MDHSILINDVVERDISATKPADFDETISATGFPKHQSRWKSSAFKQRRSGNAEHSRRFEPREQNSGSASQETAATSRAGFAEVEKKRIDQENRQRLDSMSPQEIAQAQEDLMNGLNPDLVKRLLQRATLDDPDSTSPFDQTPKDPPEQREPPPEIRVQSPAIEAATSNSSEEITDPTQNTQKEPPRGPAAQSVDEDKAPSEIPTDVFPITSPPKSTHFPVPQSLPDLDPSNPNFLETLHAKYFPDLPADPSKLAWMAPLPTENSPADKDSTYYPHPEIAVSALRFDFRGRFLSPRVSRSIPSSKGLHHHGEAPEAAGYTVAELSRLARSAVPAQRCMAFQTLGRVLYRLGRGEWGRSPEDPIASGVWAAVKKGRVLETLMEAAATNSGHRGSTAYATEALWLFEKGGWREKHQGR